MDEIKNKNRSKAIEKIKQNNKAKENFDYALLLIIVILVGVGFVMLYSTSSYMAQVKYEDSLYYVKKLLFALIFAVIAFFIAMKIDYHWWFRFKWLWYVAAVVAIMMVLIPGLGIVRNNARRWIGVGGLTIQPSEFAKLAIILFVAWFVCYLKKNINYIAPLVVIMSLVGFVSLLVWIVNDNLSTAIILFGIAAIMCFVANKKYVPFVIVIGIVALFVGIFLASIKGTNSADNFRIMRVLVWMEPEAYASEGGYQVLQGLYAIGSGGIFGKGLGKSIQKLGFIPEAQNDMIFSIICEELGLFGATGILILFVLLLWRLFVIAFSAKDLYGSMIAIGVFAHIAIQVILNVAVVTNSIPNTGITLPFISYGGTSIVFLFIEMGIVLNVSTHCENKN